MSLISDPIKSFKDQAHKIWDVKDYGERLAFTRTAILVTFIYYFMIVNLVYLFIIILINDLFILSKYYASGQAWYLEVLEEIFFQTIILQMILIFFWTSPKVVRKTLSVMRSYSSKEKGFFSWTEGKIKQKYPNFKTKAQRARERSEKPKRKTRIGKWLLALPRSQRRLIRVGVRISYGIFILSMAIYPFTNTQLGTVIIEEFFDKTINPSCRNCSIENNIVREFEQEIPKQPDGRPPSTIYDIFINMPNPVTP